MERNIDARHILNQNKYAHFCPDITNFKTTVTAFEVISRGFLSQNNVKHIQSLNRFCKAGTKLNTFKNNISSLSIYSSYHIWLCRSDRIFVQPPYLKPTFLQQCSWNISGCLITTNHVPGATVGNYLADCYLGGFIPAPCLYVDIIVVYYCTALLQQ